MHHIHCLNNISPRGTDLLTDDYALTDDISKACGILVRSAAMHDMEFSDGLLAIARAGAGVNNIPLDRCAEEGIVVFNTPGANANAVKELVLCGMLLASRGIMDGIAWCHENADNPDIAKAAEKAKKAFAGREIKNKRLGVIGLGAVGALVANAAVDLDMDVYGYDPYVSVDAAWHLSSKIKHIANLDDLLSRCDYISIHVPATKDTVGMIDEHACSLMKDGAIFLNFSRDTLVDADAFSAALDSGKIAAYVTDFAKPAVMQMKNTIVIPHLGASTAEAEENCASMAVIQMMDYFENGNIKNSVNYPACDMGVCPEEGSRITILHENIPNIIGKITSVLGNAGINIENMINKARGNAAYTMLDLSAKAPEDILEQFSVIEGVRRVRVIN